MGKPNVGPRADAYGDLQCARRRSLQDRHAVHVYGEYVVELLDEPRRRDGDADRHRRGRRLRHPAHHLLRCLFLRDGRLCRPDPARHDLSGTTRLHLTARPPDQRGRRRRRCDPLAGGGAQPRRARLSVSALRSGGEARSAGFRERGRQPEIQRLRRLHHQPRTPSGHWPAGRVPGQRRQGCRARGAEPPAD